MVVVYTAKFHYVYRLIVEHPILSMPRDNLQNIKKIKRVKNYIFTLKNMDVFNRKKALKKQLNTKSQWCTSITAERIFKENMLRPQKIAFLHFS